METQIHWWPRPPDDTAMQAVVNQRLTEFRANAERAVESINTRALSRMPEFNKRAAALVHSHESKGFLIRKLYKLADEMYHVEPGETACRRGCSHCCHIAVGVTATEADYIGKCIGIKATPSKHVRHVPDFAGFDYGYHNPCTFLVNGECSIYEHRPLACRTHYNLDVDELLCRLDPPKTWAVPYMNTIPIQTVMAAIASPGWKVADIRTWFPKKP